MLGSGYSVDVSCSSRTRRGASPRTFIVSHFPLEGKHGWRGARVRGLMQWPP